MVLPVNSTNNVKVYTVSGSNLSRKLPDWLIRRKRRELQKDIEWTRRIELIQDFEFPEASLRIKVTPDQSHCMATGVYKPQIRVFDFSNVSMKFDRHTDAENVNFMLLSDDWTKSVHLQSDRSLEFHNEGQMHFRTRIPRFGRDLAYHSPSCDVLVGGASNEVWRLNIDQGRFMTPFQTQSKTGINVLKVNPAHQLFGFGTEDGTVEFWDPRARNCIGTLEPTIPNIMQPVNGTRSGFEISAMDFRGDGLGVAIGTSSGHVMLYDLRQSRPWQVKDQQYGLPIKTLQWVEGQGGAHYEGGTVDGAKIMSADSRIIKLWSVDSGKPFTAIEPPNDINDVCMMPGSGIIFVAGECSEIQSYFIPQLGPAPRWAHFLENLTEEMEQKPQQTVYDDYKFVVRKELEALGLSHLIGSAVLKPYMHGFFVDLRLYERAKSIANPFAYEEYRVRRVQQKLDEARESRIRATTKLPKVNRALAMRLLQMQKGEKAKRGLPVDSSEDESTAKRVGGRQRKKAGAAAAAASAVLEDNRFKDMFSNPEFEVDEEEDEFKQLHTVSQKQKLATEAKMAADDEDDSSDDDGLDIRAPDAQPLENQEEDEDVGSDDEYFQ
ncbi:WD40 repeat-like protein [Coemansia reversa NRRL 1564]|uniref:WD40 repeat-like protein n=1 Tax=Coemansia reversa (strain ATCC 12441 / NRRL 1564) TaxID=763665 RepID=A0A2G5B7Q6_COERN|nr:WD40 repeat-like protein [Coemansia reversa NRRL 1564]|eukprot:PIA15066.1 WD40 repeat-like protein [Coemansia reversa NRRL 1564]